MQNYQVSTRKRKDRTKTWLLILIPPTFFPFHKSLITSNWTWKLKEMLSRKRIFDERKRNTVEPKIKFNGLNFVAVGNWYWSAFDLRISLFAAKLLVLLTLTDHTQFTPSHPIWGITTTLPNWWFIVLEICIHTKSVLVLYPMVGLWLLNP